MSAVDGLARLTAAREKATSTRHVPPPRNAPRTSVAQAEPASQPQPLAPTTSVAERTPTARDTPTTPTPTQSAGELVRCSIYVDEAADQFLERVRGVGRKARPKVDASRSAVVRLALDRLLADMTPEQIVAELRQRAAQTSSTGGRKRI